MRVARASTSSSPCSNASAALGYVDQWIGAEGDTKKADPEEEVGLPLGGVGRATRLAGALTRGRSERATCVHCRMLLRSHGSECKAKSLKIRSTKVRPRGLPSRCLPVRAPGTPRI